MRIFLAAIFLVLSGSSAHAQFSDDYWEQGKRESDMYPLSKVIEDVELVYGGQQVSIDGLFETGEDGGRYYALTWCSRSFGARDLKFSAADGKFLDDQPSADGKDQLVCACMARKYACDAVRDFSVESLDERRDFLSEKGHPVPFDDYEGVRTGTLIMGRSRIRKWE